MIDRRDWQENWVADLSQPGQIPAPPVAVEVAEIAGLGEIRRTYVLPVREFATGQRGAALVVAMLVFALVAALMVGLQRDFTLILQRGTHQVFTEQTCVPDWR